MKKLIACTALGLLFLPTISSAGMFTAHVKALSESGDFRKVTINRLDVEGSAHCVNKAEPISLTVNTKDKNEQLITIDTDESCGIGGTKFQKYSFVVEEGQKLIGQGTFSCIQEKEWKGCHQDVSSVGTVMVGGYVTNAERDKGEAQLRIIG